MMSLPEEKSGGRERSPRSLLLGSRYPRGRAGGVSRAASLSRRRRISSQRLPHSRSGDGVSSATRPQRSRDHERSAYSVRSQVSSTMILTEAVFGPRGRGGSRRGCRPRADSSWLCVHSVSRRYPGLRANAIHSSTRRRPRPRPRRPAPPQHRSFATVFDFRTTNTDPTMAPLRSAIQQRSPRGRVTRESRRRCARTTASPLGCIAPFLR